MQLQKQYRRRRARFPSRLDRVILVTALAGLALLVFSWWHFQLHALSDAAAQSQSLDSASTFCEAHFGRKWVESWNATRRDVCHPPGDLPHHVPPSSIRCASPDPDEHLPASSGPHVLCDVTNLWLEPSKTQLARCPLYRPGYLCGKKTYYRYSEGAWAAACHWPGLRVEEYFSKDHLQDIFGGMAFGAQGLPAAGAAVDVEELPTLIVTREVYEHANVFHALTDLLNVYITLEMMGWVEAARQVLILDAHPPASLDLLWPVVAAGGGVEALSQGGVSPWRMQSGGRQLVQRLGDLKAPLLLRHAVFVPPGYSSLLFAHLYEEGSCGEATSLFQGFRGFVLRAFGLTHQAGSRHGSSSSGGGGERLMVRLVTRKPSKTKRKMARQIANEEALMEMLEQVASAEGDAGGAAAGLGVEQHGRRMGDGGDRAVQGRDLPLWASVDISKLDLGTFPLPQQLEVISGTDVLVGMHGAALAFSLFLPPHAAVIELWPKSEGIWRCYEHMSLLSGLLYRRLANADPSMYEETRQGDRTQVDVEGLRGVVQEVLPAVRTRKLLAQAGKSLFEAGQTIRQS